MKISFFAVALAAIALSANSVSAANVSYTGNWQVHLTDDVYVTSQGYNGHGPDTTHCVSLTDDGTVGWKHSGYAELDGTPHTSGQVSIIGNTIMIYFEASGGEGELATITLSGTAKNGTIGERGAYEYLDGG